jgi:hypothetical protein
VDVDTVDFGERLVGREQLANGTHELARSLARSSTEQLPVGRRRLMTVIELGEVIGGLVARPTPIKSIGKLVQGARHRIAGLDAVADELVRRKEEIDDEQASALVEELRAVLEELVAALER